jgi:hypothetical protein
VRRPYYSSIGIAHPDELKLLNEVFDLICREYGLQRESPEAEDIGRAAISLFSAGVLNEAELVTSLREYLRRQTGRNLSPG